MAQILFADDHALFRHGIEALLAQMIAGAKITEAETPDEVLELLRNGRWDVILLDFSMPGRDFRSQKPHENRELKRVLRERPGMGSAQFPSITWQRLRPFSTLGYNLRPCALDNRQQFFLFFVGNL